MIGWLIFCAKPVIDLKEIGEYDCLNLLILAHELN